MRRYRQGYRLTCREHADTNKYIDIRGTRVFNRVHRQLYVPRRESRSVFGNKPVMWGGCL
jgi:hypothetical protein